MSGFTVCPLIQIHTLTDSYILISTLETQPSGQTRRVGKLKAGEKERADATVELVEELSDMSEDVSAAKVLTQKCGRGSVWPIHYELSCLQSLMTAATPAALVAIQLSYTEQLQARKVLKICPRDFEVMGVSNLKRIRPEAESWSMLEAGIAVARCKRILAVFIDETEIENVSVLSIIFLIIDEYGDLRMLTLIGLVVLSTKTAAAQVTAIVDSFTEVREMLEEVCDEYDNARINRSLVPQGGKARAHMVDNEEWTEADWEEHHRRFGMAAVEVCVPSRVHPTRIEAGSSDHCAAAQLALNECGAAVKTEEMCAEYYTEWKQFGVEQRAEKLSWIVFGCQHHLRCCGWGAMEKALEGK